MTSNWRDPAATITGPTGATGTYVNGDVVSSLSNNVTLPTYAPETNITNWGSGHGWSNQTTGNGTQSDDTVLKYRGTQSLKYVTNGNQTAAITRKTGLSIDATGKMVKLYVNIDNPSGLQEFWVVATSDSWTNFWSWKISVDMTQIKNGGVWIPLTIPFLDATITGSPNRAAISGMQIRFKDLGSAVTINLGALVLVPESMDTGVCTITFDDCWESQYTQALLKMSQSGLQGVVYTIPDLVGTPNYMTLEQLKSMQNDYGWDIASHHQTILTTVGTSEGVASILDGVKQYLISNGFKAYNHFAFPSGAYDETIVMPNVKKYFSTARTIASSKSETIPAPDWHRLRVFLILNTTTTADIASAVTKAISNKYWLILVFHRIVTTPSSSTEYSIVDFGTVIDNIVSQGIAVKTLTQIETG